MAAMVRPYRVRASDIHPRWHVIDATDKTLGRLSSEIAVLLQGKHKPIYVPYLISGDFVVVTNTDKIRVTGKKLAQKVYYRHSGYPGGLKEQTLAQVMAKTPDRAIRHAVKGMLPKNSLGRRMLSRLKLYAGASHPHEAQVNAGTRRKGAEGTPLLAETPVTGIQRARPETTGRRAPSRKKSPVAERGPEPAVIKLAKPRSTIRRTSAAKRSAVSRGSGAKAESPSQRAEAKPAKPGTTRGKTSSGKVSVPPDSPAAKPETEQSSEA